MSETRKLNLAAVDDFTRPHVVEWLRDRSAFHTWFSSLITGSFVVITVFGSKPDFDTPSGVLLSLVLHCLKAVFRVSTGLAARNSWANQ